MNIQVRLDVEFDLAYCPQDDEAEAFAAQLGASACFCDQRVLANVENLVQITGTFTCSTRAAGAALAHAQARATDALRRTPDRSGDHRLDRHVSVMRVHQVVDPVQAASGSI